MVKYGINKSAGKWGRAISTVGDMWAAWETPSIEVVEITSPAVHVLNTMQNDNIIDLYSVGHEEVTRMMCDTGVKVPFQHTLHLLGPQGEIVRVTALFDGCAMVSEFNKEIENGEWNHHTIISSLERQNAARRGNSRRGIQGF